MRKKEQYEKNYKELAEASNILNWSVEELARELVIEYAELCGFSGYREYIKEVPDENIVIAVCDSWNGLYKEFCYEDYIY